MKELIEKRGRWISLTLFGLGAIVFTLLEITVPGLILLIGAFLVGVYTIASPEQLADDDPPPQDV
jgi:hypothetical protein